MNIVLKKILVNFQANKFLSSRIRQRLLRLTGVQVGKRCFIGSDVTFDGIHPEYIDIGYHVHITSGVKLLTHYFQPDDYCHSFGRVKIGNYAFIGINALIINSVEIGEGAVVGAGAVVTKNIPPWEIWGGNPARFIRKRKKLLDNQI